MNFNEAVNTVYEKLNAWIESFVVMLPNMLVSIILFLFFFALAKASKRAFGKIFKKASHNKALEALFSTIVYYTVLGLGFFIVLGILQLDKAVTSLLAGIGVVGLALGFAFQDIAANFVSGVIIAFRKPFNIEDVIEVKGYMGRVARTNLRVTVIRTFQGQEVYIPNKDVLQNPIVNYSALGKRRIDLGVGISYGDSLPKVEEVVTEAVSKLPGVIEHDNLIFDYQEFGDSSINFNIRFWIPYPDQPGFLKMRSEAVKTIKAAFDQNNITIPFPIRTLDFGIKGGQTLSEMPISFSNKSNRKN